MTQKKTTHQKFGWNAKDFFDDPKVIEFCEVIEANDLEKIQSMIDAGVDVNAKGKGNMTPLRWAYPDNKLERFEMLLKARADPNVFATDNLGVPRLMFNGSSVTHWACKSSFEYFEAVFKYGGDPNLPSKSKLGLGQTPIFSVIGSGGPNVKKRIKRLLEMGADINQPKPVASGGATPLMQAASPYGQYGICLFLLENGADPSIYQSNFTLKLTHTLAKSDGLLKIAGPKQKADYERLVEKLLELGESVDEAKEDLKRHRSYIVDHNKEDRRKLFDAEREKNKKRWLERQKLLKEPPLKDD